MNKVLLIGNLTRDPEQTQTPSGVAVCKFSIAVSRGFKDSDGNRETDFFNITVWRGRASPRQALSKTNTRNRRVGYSFLKVVQYVRA